MNETKLSKYYRLLKNLKILPLDAYKLYFWPLDSEQRKQSWRKGYNYLEEYRLHYLNYEYRERINFHKCTGSKDERYILFPDSEHVSIDPWEIVTRYYPLDLNKLKETSAEHVYFEILYQIPNYDNVYQISRHSILRLMEFYNLFHPFETSSGLNQKQFRKTTGNSWIDINRLCLKCGAMLESDANEGMALTCKNKNNNRSSCYNNLADQSIHKTDSKIPILTTKTKKQYMEHHNKIAKNIAKLVIKSCNKRITRQGYVPGLDPGMQGFLEDSINIKKIKESYKEEIKKRDKHHHQTLYECLLKQYKSVYNSKQEYTWGKFLLNQTLIEQYINL